MQIADKYSPQEIEQKWYDYWIDNRLFHSEPDGREPYTIVIPPPNVTGMLHMGHMLNNTLQDVLIRRARMSGKNACWVPGMDHASIATEAKVVAMLHEKGIEKSSLTREESTRLFYEVEKDYLDVKSKIKRFKEIRENPHFNALQVKFSYAVTCHKAQGGQWKNVFLDQGYMTDEYLTPDYFRWLYTAFTRATGTLYLVNYPKEQIC